jgi:5-oxoprolinase (ATP-hydrolysing)
MATGRSTTKGVTELDPITLEIFWSRLLAIADEVWGAIERTAFSTIVASAHDFGVEVMDENGGSLGHAHQSMPVFNLAMPRVTQKILEEFPREEIRPGDVYCANDPWLCCGHVPDLAVLTPVFRGETLIAWVGSICHHADFGGAHRSRSVREVYEEGMMIPPMRMISEGKRDETLFKLIQINVRNPEMVLGDIEAQLAANELGMRRLLELQAEYELDDFRHVATAIQERSEAAMRNAIFALPDGLYTGETWVDSSSPPFKINVTIRVHGDELTVDYEGTGDQVESGGINCTFAYTMAQTHYGIKYSLTPDIPNNEGCFRPIHVKAPEGSILNCTFPASVGSRSKTGWFIHGPLVSALAKASPVHTRAEHGFLQSFMTRGQYPDGETYNASMFMGAGQGAGWEQDGISGWIFPSSASGVPVEVFESRTPLWIQERRILPNTGGPGRFRGGPGSRVKISKRPDYDDPVRVWLRPNRLQAVSQGIHGGLPGSPSRVTLNGESPADDSDWARTGFFTLSDRDDLIVFDLPGGGGMGQPQERDPSRIFTDINEGYVTDEGLESYGVSRGDLGQRNEDGES